jgi:hypothetical protein
MARSRRRFAGPSRGGEASLRIFLRRDGVAMID